jgi:hypothetical protein
LAKSKKMQSFSYTIGVPFKGNTLVLSLISFTRVLNKNPFNIMGAFKTWHEENDFSLSLYDGEKMTITLWAEK